ncbi:hypothetical protein P280DRAFT_378109, partial [Massarina eburnea CBS 473.64]
LVSRGLPGAVYICTGPGFSGNCGWTPPSDECHIGGSTVASIGPDEGGHCTTYKGQNCNDNTKLRVINYPGIRQGLEDFGSLKCEK